MLESIITYSFIAMGLLGVVYSGSSLLFLLLVTLPALQYVPTLSIDPYEGALRVLKAGSINIYLMDFFVLLLFLTLVGKALSLYKHDRASLQQITSSPLTRYMFFLFLWSLLVGLLSYLQGFTAQNILRKLSVECLVFIAVLVPLMGGRKRWFNSVFKFTVFLAVIVVAFGLVRYFITGEVEVTSSGTGRSLLGNVVVLLMFPVCYVLFNSRFWQKSRLLSFCFILAVSVGIHLTGHRSGYIVLLIVAGFYFIRTAGRQIESLWVPLTFACTLLIVCIYANSVSLSPGNSMLGDAIIRAEDTFNLENSTTMERLDKWALSIQVLKQNPLLGLGHYPVHTDDVDPVNNQHLLDFDELNKATHNMFFEKIVNEGLLGFFVVVGLLVVVFRQVRSVYVEDEHLGTMLFVYFLVFFVFSLFNTSFSASAGKIYLFFAIGVLNKVIIEKKNGKILEGS